MPLDWGREEEFLQSVFLRSHSIHSRLFYWSGLEQFPRLCVEEKVGEMDDRNVYDVLDAFVRWNDARGIRPKTIIDYLCSAKKFLLYQDVSIGEQIQEQGVRPKGHEDRGPAPQRGDDTGNQDWLEPE